MKIRLKSVEGSTAWEWSIWADDEKHLIDSVYKELGHDFYYKFSGVRRTKTKAIEEATEWIRQLRAYCDDGTEYDWVHVPCEEGETPHWGDQEELQDLREKDK